MTRHDEDGVAAGAEALVLGVLVFVVGTLIMVNAWSVVDARMAVDAAAREAVRAVVEAAPRHGEGPATSDHYAAVARVAAEDSLRASRGDRLGRDEDGDGGLLARGPVVEGGLARGQCVEVTVSVEVPVVALPLVGAEGGTRTVEGSHRARVDPYRSGLTGAAGEVAPCT